MMAVMRQGLDLFQTLAVCGTLLTLSLPLAASPRVDYYVRCAGCHRPDGTGLSQSVPDLRVSLPVLLRASGGREFLVQVPGTAQSSLSDAEVAAVLNWMVDSFATPPPSKWIPYTGEEVSRVRRTPLINVNATRDALLSAGAPRK